MDADAGVQDARKGNTRKDKEYIISYEAYSVFYYIGCDRQGVYSQQTLNLAEQLVATNPDSAYTLIST